MADNEYNDEYQFDEQDTMDSEPLNASDSDTEVSTKKRGEGSNIRRNALIVVVAVVLIMLGYKFFGSFFSTKVKPAQEIPSAPAVTEQPPPVTSVAPIPQQPITPVNTTPVVVQSSTDNTQINQKLSSLEASELNVRSEVNSVNNKLTGISMNVGELTEKIANLNQTISTLASKLDQQSTEIAILTERTKPKSVPRVVVKVPTGPTYYLQAIIPGRAWLIATNGSTITVREGTQIVGYGVVKLIDPNQGLVLTSSGRVIRFSQQDS